MRKLVISGFAAMALLSAPAFAQTSQAPTAPAKPAPAVTAPAAPAAKPAAPMAAPAAPHAKPADAKATDAKATGQLLDLNTATKQQLQDLKGVGPVRADAIIKGRPYKGKDELLQKKILPQNVYDDVKAKIIARQH